MSERRAGRREASTHRRGGRRSFFAALTLLFLVGASAGAQTPPRTTVGPPAKAPSAVGPPGGEAAPELRLLVFRFQHQRASEALTVVRGLLSSRGSVALDEASNTLSVRESPAVLSRISVAVRTLDHAAQPVWLAVELIRAEVSSVSPVPKASDVAPEIANKLRQLFRFQYFALLARGRIESREGESVQYEMGNGYRLSFQLGTIVDGRRLRLSSFEMTRSADGKPDRALVRTAVNLGLDQPLILGLTNDEAADRALMLVLRYEVPATGK